ncbi:MAG: SDR family oxidoreductase [Pirellulaceae bacterium]
MTLQETFQTTAPVALITGSGSKRVGRAIAARFARLGCNIALHANTSVQEAEQAATEFQESYGIETIVTQGSLVDDATPDRIVAETHAAFGRIDILVNSAAIWTPTKLQDITAKEMRRYFDINTLGSFLCARAAGERMVMQDSGGAIINIGDWATVRPYMDHAAYFPSKGAIEVMTRSLAVELASRNNRIRVNCIQPGPVLLADDVSDEHQKKIAGSTLVGRVGTAEQVAHAATFLCENDFITGVCLPVDGGRQIYAPDNLQVGMNTG